MNQVPLWSVGWNWISGFPPFSLSGRKWENTVCPEQTWALQVLLGREGITNKQNKQGCSLGGCPGLTAEPAADSSPNSHRVCEGFPLFFWQQTTPWQLDLFPLALSRAQAGWVCVLWEGNFPPELFLSSLPLFFLQSWSSSCHKSNIDGLWSWMLWQFFSAVWQSPQGSLELVKGAGKCGTKRRKFGTNFPIF